MSGSLKSSLLRPKDIRILYVRFVAMVMGFLLGILILSYSLYFYYVFLTVKATLSYFPWAWQILYRTSDPVIVLTATGVLLAITVCLISGIGSLVFYRAVQNYSPSESIETIPKSTPTSLPATQPRRRMFGMDTPTLVFVVAILMDLLGIGLALRDFVDVSAVLIFLSFLGIAYYALKVIPPRQKKVSP